MHTLTLNYLLWILIIYSIPWLLCTICYGKFNTDIPFLAMEPADCPWNVLATFDGVLGDSRAKELSFCLSSRGDFSTSGTTVLLTTLATLEKTERSAFSHLDSWASCSNFLVNSSFERVIVFLTWNQSKLFFAAVEVGGWVSWQSDEWVRLAKVLSNLRRNKFWSPSAINPWVAVINPLYNSNTSVNYT